MAENITIVPSKAELERQFAFVNSLIERYRSSAIAMVNTTALQMYWEIGIDNTSINKAVDLQ